MTSTQARQNFGFTLVEVLIVITIIMILLAASVEGFQRFATRSGSDASAQVVMGTLEEAHAFSLSAQGDTQYGVHFATDSVTLFTGATYVSGDSSNVVRPFTRARINTINLSDGGADVVFSRLRGNASATGTIEIVQTADTSLTRTITIHETGLVEVH